jgi:hypothetical protein
MAGHAVAESWVSDIPAGSLNVCDDDEVVDGVVEQVPSEEQQVMGDVVAVHVPVYEPGEGSAVAPSSEGELPSGLEPPSLLAFTQEPCSQACVGEQQVVPQSAAQPPGGC